MDISKSYTSQLSELCRGCLVSSGEMKNMTEWGLLYDFSRITNIKINHCDVISQLLCTSCEEMLVKSQQWIALCQKSDDYLRNTAKKKEKDAEEAIEGRSEPNVSCLLFEEHLLVMIIAPDPVAKIHLPCPYKCQTFMKKPDLFQHMLKTHLVDAKFVVNLQYYCHVDACPYHIESGANKFFIGRKQLNQHYNKVHKDKQTCAVCELNFSTMADYNRHLKSCCHMYECRDCHRQFQTNERLLVHLMRKHPLLHKQYKEERRAEKRKAKMVSEAKKVQKSRGTGAVEDKFDYICDSPKRSFATQTLANIKNDVTLSSWSDRSDITKRDEISTQTVFEDLLSLKSEEDSIFCSETVSLSDIQTQTFPLEFGLSRSHKETITSETQSPDLSLKGTQTCFCLYDSPRSNRFVDNVTSSPGNFTSTETQTADLKHNMTDVLLSFSSTETQTCFDELKDL